MKYFPIVILILLTQLSCDRYSKDKIIESNGITEGDEMLIYLNDLLKDDPNNPKILFKRAQVYFDHSDTRRSLIDVQKALELNPTDPDYYLLLGRIFDLRNRPEDCLTAALQAEKRGLHNYELYRMLAVNYLKLNDAENAKNSIERLLEFNRNGENLSLQGDIFLQLMDTVEAINSYEKAIAQKHPISRPYKELYQIYLSKNQTEKAESYLDQYLAKNKDDSDFLILKASLMASIKSYDSALIYYNKADVIHSEEKKLLVDYGNLFYTLTDFDSALLIANRIVELDSQYVEANLLAARSLDKLRNYKESKKVYESILEYDSTVQIATKELDILNRKVAYLWRLQRQEKAFDSIRNSPPPAVERKEIEN